MAMFNERELLEKGRDSWAESAKHDKWQFLSSLAMAAGGVILVGVGIKAVLRGDAYGLVAIGTGGAIAGGLGYVGYEEIGDFADSVAHTTEHQIQIDKLV